MTTSQTERIQELNDVFRTTWLTGKVLMTCGIQSLAKTNQSRVVEAVQSFTAFTPDNDPHGEHDFGAVTVDGYKVFWRIDYYDQTLQYGSEDPTNPAVTKRVLSKLGVASHRFVIAIYCLTKSTRNKILKKAHSTETFILRQIVDSFRFFPMPDVTKRSGLDVS